MAIVEQVLSVIESRGLADPEMPVVLMVSGGSDSAALAYIAADLHRRGKLGPLAMLHVNHQLRGEEADRDEAFVKRLAALLDVPLTCISVDVQGLCDGEGGNVEAVARRLRYQGAHDALAALCQQHAVPVSEGRIFVAHTADDRVENFFMRSIVGTGPGGFRSMRYLNGQIARPLLDLGREQLRSYLDDLARSERSMGRGEGGELWCEDSTNSQTDRFRAFVRHEIVPLAKERNPRLLDTLVRTMNRIGDEDDMLEARADRLLECYGRWLEPQEEGCLLAPALALEPVPLQRRVAVKVLRRLLGQDARIEGASVDAVLEGFGDGGCRSGYVANIQGNLAVSANRNGVRVEPMAAFRTRRNKL